MRKNLLFIFLFVFLAGMAACSPQAVQTQSAPQATETPTPAAETQPAATVADESQPSASATLDVEALILEKLAGHHDVERIYSAEKTYEEWVQTLDRMIGYGAKINEEEKQIIIEFLMNR